MDWLATWGARTPSYPAVIDAGSGLVTTYRELDDRAGRLARVLSERCGVGRGDRVAVLAYNCREVLELVFACRRIGAILVPLNWRLAARELVRLVEDCRPAALVYEATWAQLVRSLGARVDIPARLVIRGPANGGALRVYEAELATARRAKPVAIDPDEIAMILYTSGTTGVPKGAMLPWRQIEFNADITVERCALSSEDRGLACLPMFHAGGLNCLVLPLVRTGATVVTMRSFDAEAALDQLEARGITATIGVPTVYELLLAAGLARCRLPRLRCALIGGAPVSLALLHAYAELGIRLRQGYGLTEAGPNCFTFGPDDRPDSIGKPVPGTRARVVGDDGADVSTADTVGELWLAGPHLLAGYWNNADETARALDRDGWLHTGDYVKRDDDGNYYVVGRKKDMFISGGENVYPAEVEGALAEHADVEEVCVVGVPDARWGEVGLAAIVARIGAAVDADALRAWTRERLARYKVPAHWVFVDALPVGSSGKVAKDRVRAMCWTDAAGAQ